MRISGKIRSCNVLSTRSHVMFLLRALMKTAIVLGVRITVYVYCVCVLHIWLRCGQYRPKLHCFDEMEAQIFDVDAVQVGTGDPAWTRLFRSNQVSYLCSPSAREYSRRVSIQGAVFAVRLWCRTRDGKSLCVVICNPWGTSYRRLKRSTATPTLEALALNLQRELNAASRSGSTEDADVGVVFKKTTSGFHVDHRNQQSILYPWLRMRVSSTFLKKQLVSLTAKAQDNAQLCLPITAESNVEIHLQTLESLSLRPGSWLRLCEEASLRVAGEVPKLAAALHVQILQHEIVLSQENLEAQLAPIRVLSWDIECYSKEHAFPQATNTEDCIIAIGACSRTLYAEDEKSESIVITLGDVSDIPGEDEGDSKLNFIQCNREIDVLRRFADIVANSDADIIVGYNICGFDWKYLQERIELLTDCGEISADEKAIFFRFSRILSETCVPEDRVFESSAHGSNPLCRPRMPGRIGVDLYYYLKCENSPELANLKLNTVSEHYLGDAKVDLPAKQMFYEFERSASGRRLVAVYCCKDCTLVLDLLYKLNIVPRLFEMAKITCTIPEDLLYRGQQLKVYTQLLLAAHDECDFLVEDVKSAPAVGDGDGDLNKYQGAHVEDPVSGFYTEPILTVDFASLYPSLMRTYNLSPDTLLGPTASDYEHIPHSTVTVHPDRPPLRFVSPSHTKGLLPKILDSLTQERKKAKKAMETDPCPFRRQILNAKQLALKISANSVYGACGATKGLLQCREVAEATTATGRDIIAFTKQCIEQEYKVRGCTVIYGICLIKFLCALWCTSLQQISHTHYEVTRTLLFSDSRKSSDSCAPTLSSVSEKTWLRL